nr:VTT domain-containing protein [Streptomyces spiramenti]
MPETPLTRAAVIFRLLVLCALLGGGVLAAATLEPQRLLTEDTLGSAGLGTWAVFTLGFGVLSALMVPRPVMVLAAGALFGAAAGTALAVAGTMLGAAAGFAVGRVLGQRALRPLVRGRALTAADRQLSSHGFRSLLVLRLVPILPFAVVNTVAAVSRVPWLPFLAATALGGLPQSTAFAVAGSRATDPVSPAFLSAVAFLVLSGPVAGAVWRRRQARREQAAAPPGHEGRTTDDTTDDTADDDTTTGDTAGTAVPTGAAGGVTRPDTGTAVLDHRDEQSTP